MSAGLNNWRGQLQDSWSSMSAPRQLWLGLSVLGLSLVLIWAVAVRPASHMLERASQSKSALAAQLGEMQALATVAQQLKNQPTSDPASRQRDMTQSVRDHLGMQSPVQHLPDQIQVSFKGVASEKLSALLADARTRAATVTQMQATRSTPAGTAWDGQLTLQLPATPR
jgi:type II secretory pathway component PulM